VAVAALSATSTARARNIWKDSLSGFKDLLAGQVARLGPPSLTCHEQISLGGGI
jgi:hypothetical protein